MSRLNFKLNWVKHEIFYNHGALCQKYLNQRWHIVYCRRNRPGFLLSLRYREPTTDSKQNMIYINVIMQSTLQPRWHNSKQNVIYINVILQSTIHSAKMT